MKMLSRVAGVVAVLCLLGVQMMRGQSTGPFIFAENYAQWSFASQSPNTYIFGGNCMVPPAANVAPIFAFGAAGSPNPVAIMDTNTPSNSEIVTPSRIVQTAGQCGFSGGVTRVHNGFTVVSGTGGLQEAIRAQGTSLAGAVTIALDAQWYGLLARLPGAPSAASIIASVKGNTSVNIVDTTTTPPCWAGYTWNGTNYQATSGCASMGAGTVHTMQQRTTPSTVGDATGITTDGAGNLGVSAGVLAGNVNGVFNPLMLLDNTGVADVSAALQAFVNGGAVDFLVPAGYYNLGTTTITIPSTVHRFEVSPGATFLYQGTGIAMEYRGLGTSNSGPIQYHFSSRVVHGSMVAGVPTPAIHWHDGGSPDLTSMGVVCRNCYHVDFKPAAQGFWTGAALIGDGPTAAGMGGNANGGSAENEITLGNLEDNMIAYQHLVISSGPNIGWTNQNTIYHGEPRINGSNCVGGSVLNGPYPGTKYILMSTGSDNMNTFVGTELEGACVERALDIYGNSNTWFSPRFEGMQAASVVFESTSIGNRIYTPFISRFDGTGNGSIASVVVDNGTSNEFHGYLPSWQADVSGSNENTIQFTDSNTINAAVYQSQASGSVIGTVGQTCTVALVSSVGGTAGGATATVALTGTNVIAGGTAMTMTNNGQFYGNTYPAPLTGNLGNGTATCTGVANLTSTVGKTVEFYYNNASRTMIVGGAGVGVVKTGSFLFQDGSSVPKLLNGNLTVPNAVLFGTSLLGTVGGGNLLRLYSNNNTDQNQVSLSADAGNTAGSSGAKLISTYNSGGTTDFRLYNAGLLAAMFHLGNVGVGGAITPTHAFESGSSAQAYIDSTGNGFLTTLFVGAGGASVTGTKTASTGAAGAVPVSIAGGAIDPSFVPTATSSVIGGVKPDNTTITVSGGVLSATGLGATSCYRVGSLGTPVTTTGGTVAVTMATIALPALLSTSQLRLHYDAFGNAGNTGTLTAAVNIGASLVRSIGGISAVNTYEIVDEELRNEGSTSAQMETARFAKTGAAIFLTNNELTIATGSAQNLTIKFTPTVGADTWVLKDADVVVCP